jgi:hypothetical protein
LECCGGCCVRVTKNSGLLRAGQVPVTMPIAALANGSETWAPTGGKLRTRLSGRVGRLWQIVAGIDAVLSRAGRIPALGGKLVPLVESGFDRHKIFHFLLT